MPHDLIKPIIFRDQICWSREKYQRLLRRNRMELPAVLEERKVKGRQKYLHPTKGYRGGPHYPGKKDSATWQRKGMMLIIALGNQLKR